MNKSLVVFPDADSFISATRNVVSDAHSMYQLKPATYKRDAPSHGDVVCLQYLEYECGYCKVRKVSTSTGGDGRVRIRCECGGKHNDGQPRMHAKWKLCRQLSRRDQMLELAYKS